MTQNTAPPVKVVDLAAWALAIDGENGLLVADDVGNTIWRVTGPAGDS
jgi:hypothetical protein